MLIYLFIELLLKFYFRRGAPGDPIEFHVSENAANALIGQLIYKNLSEEVQRSISRNDRKLSAGPVNIDSSKNLEQRSLNSNFMRSKLNMEQTYPFSMRGNRNTNQEFYVPVAPTIFYDAPNVFEPENNPNSMFRESMLENQKNHTDVNNFLSQIKFVNDVSNASMSDLFVDSMAMDPPIEDLLSRVINKKSILSKQGTISKVVLVTPRPFRNHLNEKTKKINNLNLPGNGKRSEKKIVSQDDSILSGGSRFSIANQNDIEDMISIKNDGTLMTIKGLDREHRDIYRLTIIAEYYQGLVGGAGIYQVVIYVDDVNDNAPVFNLHSYSGSIFENSLTGTEVVLDQQILVHDADIDHNAVFDLSLQGESSIFFAIEKRNLSHNTLDDPTLLYSIGNKEFTNALTKISSRMNVSNDILPRYVIKYIGPNILDRETQNFYQFNIIAKDKGGLSSEAKFTLHVKDVNDNAPVIEKIGVYKNAGIKVQQLPENIDLYSIDHAEPETLTYPMKNLMNNDENIMAGSSNLNYEMMQLVEGAHIGPRHLNANMINNKMDIHHTISSRSRVRQKNIDKLIFSILENVVAGNPIIQIKAIDDDYENNAQLHYEIVTETLIFSRATPKRMQTSKFFGIDSHTGDIRAYRELPAQAEINLNVTVNDNGGLSDSIEIKFRVSSWFFFLNYMRFKFLMLKKHRNSQLESKLTAKMIDIMHLTFRTKIIFHHLNIMLNIRSVLCNYSFYTF